MFLIPFTTLAALSDTMKLTLGHISNSSQTSFGLSMILSAVWECLNFYLGFEVTMLISMWQDFMIRPKKRESTSKKRRGSKESLRKEEGKGKDREEWKITKKKRKHWKSKSEVGKENLISLHQCLGSGSGSVWSARFWLPGSGTAKICRSTEPIPRGKISTKNCKKKLFTPKTKIWTCYLSWSWDMDWH